MFDRARRISLESLEPRRLLSSPDGIIVFMSDRDGNHEIYSMDPDGTNLRNLTNNPAIDAIPQVSDDGTKIAFASDRGHPGNIDIWLMDIDGTNLVNITHNGLPGATNWDPAPSPDNSKVLYMGPKTGGGNYDLWVSDANGTNPRNLTNGQGGNFASWSDDGTKIVFGSFVGNQEEIYWMNADGSQRTRVTYNPTRDTYPAFTPDATKIAFTTDRDGNREIYQCNLDGSGLINLTNNPATDQVPYYSPDTGDRISFNSDRDGNMEVYLMNANGSNQVRITNNPAQDVYPGWGETPDAIAPTVLAAGFAATARTVTFRFSEDVAESIASTDLVLTNLSTNSTVPANAVSYDDATETASFSFAALPDGSYRATLPAAAVSDEAGNALATAGEYRFIWATGTAGSDSFIVSLNLTGDTVTVTRANPPETLSAPRATLGTVAISAEAGNDSLKIVGQSASDVVTFAAGVIDLGGLPIALVSIDQMQFDGRGGGDVVIANSSLTFTAAQDLQSLSIGGGASVLLPGGGDKLLLTRALVLSPGARLHLADNDLIVDYSAASPLGTWNGSAYGGITSWIATGRASQSGVTSAAPNPLIALGVAEAKDSLALAAGQTAVWGGRTVDATSVLVKYTYAGDANLDGEIDADDYAWIDFYSQIPGSSSYVHGDFNLDGKINADDYALIDLNAISPGDPL
jgi:hypothetical protein